ncbi:hypothetical protein IQ235_09255 [Oscillatoriales cyanobacterium LEGE 11467]|uniref:Uncharacterized protein n=1 Tax=Zarconia navalis LEGE 11467 TaxID=1828826 RepID=A0A928VZ47_9CYAN|nr:hypothetical protein [Zarconia navalis]MBE9040966.1 hypothetical protein [Zarconia navalis LEGE 11467]
MYELPSKAIVSLYFKEIGVIEIAAISTRGVLPPPYTLLCYANWDRNRAIDAVNLERR